MPLRKRSAWGTLTRIDSSTWRLRYWSTGPDGYKRRSKTIRNASRLDAERVRSELMLAHSDDAPCPTVGEVWDSYALPDLERRVDGGELAGNSLGNYSRAWRLHVGPQWSDVQCDAVRPLAVQQWLYGMSLSAARVAKQVLTLVLDYAVRYELVSHNVGRERYLMPSKTTITARDRGVWTLDELGEVWRAVHGEWFEAAFLLAGFGGLRVGEALGVRSEDVGESLGCAMVDVRRQIAHTSNVPTERLKTPQSARTVPVPGRAGARIIELAAERGGWLTSDGVGGPASQARLKKAWSEIGIRDELRHPFTNLRNSWQTNARWSQRIPPMFLEPMLGHKVAGVTGAHYDRPAAQMFAEVMAESYAAHPFDAGWDWA